MIPMADFKLDILVASNIGTLKHVEYDSRPKSKRKVHQLKRVSELQKGEGITCMSWYDAEQTSIIFARKNRQLQTYDVVNKEYRDFAVADFGEGRINAVQRRGELAFGSCESGVVKVWTDRAGKAGFEIDTGGKLDAMRPCDEADSIIATGGNENDLKLWNVETKSEVFKAKNVPHDWLELRVPIWVSGVNFMPETDGKVVAICSRYGVVRLYDVRAQRRPVCSVEMEGQAASCITNGKRERHVLVGTGRGFLNLVDLRKNGHLSKSYKDSVGAITDIVYDKNRDVVLATSLDRHLRMYNFESKELIYKQYLTSKLTCLLLRSNATSIKEEENEDVEIKTEAEDVEVKEEECSDQEYEEMFENMEVIRDGTESKSKVINDATPVKAENKKKKKRKNKKSESEEVVEVPTPKRKKDNLDETETAEPDLDESIKKLLKSTEKQKKKLEKIKKEKKAKSLFSKY